jgi:hypothetical protein
MAGPPLAPEEPMETRGEEHERGSREWIGQGGSQTANDIGVNVTDEKNKKGKSTR